MRRLALYAADPLARLEREPPRGRDPSCQRCELHEGVRNPCLSGEGEPGGLLVIGESPGRDEDAIGRPFIGASGRELRGLVAEHWRGPVAIDNAIRCAPARREVKEKHLEHCRGFLASTLAEARPTRVITLGAWAARAVTGRSFALFGSRRAYSYLYGQSDDQIPVFHVLHPAAALRNRFIMQWFRADMAWALTCEPPPPAPTLAGVRLVETVEDARAACAELTAAQWAAFDVETAGIMYEKSFRMLCLSACARGSTSPWAWDRDRLADAGIRRELAAWLESPRAKKLGQNVKFDVNASLLTLGARVRGVVGDTRLWRKLLEPEAEAKLDKMAELVGMGGTKEEARAAMEGIVGRVRKALSAEAVLEKRAKEPDRKWPRMQQANVDALEWWKTFEEEDPHLAAVIRLDPSEWERWAYGILDREDRALLIRYNARDAVTTARLAAEQEGELAKVPEINRVRAKVVDPAAHGVSRIEEWGVHIDRHAVDVFDTHLTNSMEVVQRRIDACANANGMPDFNPDSPDQVADLLFNRLKLRASKKTDGGKLSTDKSVLEGLADKHPFVKDLVEHRRLAKLKGTYVDGMRAHVRSDGRIHPSVLLDGATSGRASCIAGWCLVRTQRGDVRMDEVAIGDMVWTHRGRWRAVTRVLRQGARPVVRKHLSNGEVLTCTTDHRLLGSDLVWREAHEYAGESQVGGGELQNGPGALSVAREYDGLADREAPGHTRSERAIGCENVFARGRARGVEDAEVFGEQARFEEPHVRQDRGSAPQLGWGGGGRARVHDGALERGAAVCASRRDDAGVGRDEPSGGDGCAPHRRGPEEQRARQPRARDEAGAGAHSLLAGEGLAGVVVTQDEAGGSVEVHDLTVDEDHSFMVCGVFAHNCREPNLQNIPRPETVEGKMARDMFCATPGNVLVSLDYSQLELRIAAALSQDPKMIAIFEAGVDYHQRTAEMVSRLAWGISPEQVVKKHRSAAKTINFAVLYGMGDAALAAKIGCSVEEAKRVKNAIMGEFHVLADWIAECLAYSRKTGLTWTYWERERARRRPLYQIADQDGGKRITAENGAFNTPVQGTAAEYCTASLGRGVDWIDGEGLEDLVKLVLPVHDQLLLDVHPSMVRETIEVVRGIMLSWDSCGVPIVVDVETGPAWGSLVKWKEVA